MGHETVDLYLRNGNQLFCGEISSQFQNRMGKSKEQMQQERSVIPFGRRKRYKKNTSGVHVLQHWLAGENIPIRNFLA